MENVNAGDIEQVRHCLMYALGCVNLSKTSRAAHVLRTQQLLAMVAVHVQTSLSQQLISYAHEQV
jgi:hypothetical protein